MQIITAYLMILVFILPSSVFAAEETGSTVIPKVDSVLSSYRLGSGDRIKIQVFGEDSLSVEIRLSDAGTISYPFLGELQIKSLTIGQLQDLIASGLDGDYLVSPKVSVSVLEYRQFFVNGEVNKPGSYPYVPGLTIRKAISIAGGFTDYASENKMGLIRDNNEGSEEEIVGQDAHILPGDIINVKESFF